MSHSEIRLHQRCKFVVGNRTANDIFVHHDHSPSPGGNRESFHDTMTMTAYRAKNEVTSMEQRRLDSLA